MRIRKSINQTMANQPDTSLSNDNDGGDDEDWYSYDIH